MDTTDQAVRAVELVAETAAVMVLEPDQVLALEVVAVTEVEMV